MPVREKPEIVKVLVKLLYIRIECNLMTKTKTTHGKVGSTYLPMLSFVKI